MQIDGCEVSNSASGKQKVGSNATPNRKIKRVNNTSNNDKENPFFEKYALSLSFNKASDAI